MRTSAAFIVRNSNSIVKKLLHLLSPTEPYEIEGQQESINFQIVDHHVYYLDLQKANANNKLVINAIDFGIYNDASI